MFPSKRNTAQWGLYPESLDLLKGPVWLDCSITAGLQRPPPCSTVKNRTQESRRVVHTGSRLAARTTVASPPGQGPLHGDKLPPRAVHEGICSSGSAEASGRGPDDPPLCPPLQV